MDLPETLRIGQDIFRDVVLPNGSKIHFFEHVDNLEKVDVAYFGSSLEYVEDIAPILASVLQMDPELILVTDTFAGRQPSFVTLQVNMTGRKMAYRIFQLEELIGWFKDVGYEIIYKSVNYQPTHSFDNFPEEYRVRDSCNFLFKKSSIVV